MHTLTGFPAKNILARHAPAPGSAYAPARSGKTEEELSSRDELRIYHEQMLMLRNANLTHYERERVVAAEVDDAVLDEKYGFLRTMEELESEILELDDARGATTEFASVCSRYKDMLIKIYDDNKDSATRALISGAGASKAARQTARPDDDLSPTRPKQLELALSSISKRKYVVRRIHAQHLGWMGEKTKVEEQESSFWVKKGTQSQDIYLFGMWNERAIGPRERVRRLGKMVSAFLCIKRQGVGTCADSRVWQISKRCWSGCTMCCYARQALTCDSRPPRRPILLCAISMSKRHFIHTWKTNMAQVIWPT